MTTMTKDNNGKMSTGGSTLPMAEIERLSRETWAHMLKNSFERMVRGGQSGFKYKGNVARSLSIVVGTKWKTYNDGERDALKNAVRQFLRFSGNAICIVNDRPNIEYWLSDKWHHSSPVPVGIPTGRTDRQENWFEKKVTDQEITGGYDPFPVTTRRANGDLVEPLTHSPRFSDAKRDELAGKVKTKVEETIPPRSDAPKIDSSVVPFKLDSRWVIELIYSLKRSDKDSVFHRLCQMVVSWDESFTTDTFAQLYNTNVIAPAGALATLSDAGLITGRKLGAANTATEWSSTPEQRKTLRDILDTYQTAAIPARNLTYTRDLIIGGLFVRKYQTTEELARKLFLNRSKLQTSMLKLISEGLVERLPEGRESKYRLATPQSGASEPANTNPTADLEKATEIPLKTKAEPKKKAPDPAPSPGLSSTPKPTATPQNTALVPSSTMQIARDVERLIEKATEATRDEKNREITELRRQVHDLQTDKNAALEAVKQLEAKVHDLEEWKAKFKAMIDS